MSDKDTFKQHPVKGGRFFRKEEINEFRKNFEAQNKAQEGTLRRGEFFSKEILNQILSTEGCDGVRIYYGLAAETPDMQINAEKGNKEMLQPRLFIVPVTVERNAEGKATEKSKDQTFVVRVDAGKDGGDEFGGGGEGLPCPGFCNP